MNLSELKAIYRVRKTEIEKIWRKRKEPKGEEEMFAILASCILSSRAKWLSVRKAIDRLENDHTLIKGDLDDVKKQLKGISGRYINITRLAEYILLAREQFPFLYSVIKSIQSNNINLQPRGLGFQNLIRLGEPKIVWESLQKEGLSPEGLREMVKEVKGIGYKQASHFLAALGYEDYAVLDVYVLDCLVEWGVIKEKPKYLTHKEYLMIENKMKEFSKTLGIPFFHLDTLIWQEGSGVKGND